MTENVERTDKVYICHYHIFSSYANNLFPHQSTFVNYFHTTQNQYMLFWL